MNKEIRELFDKHHIITKKITLKNNVRIIDTGKEQLVIKRRDKNLDEIYQYLQSRSFNYYPEILYQTEHYDIYKYIQSVEIPPYEKSADIINLTTLLHSKTTFYKDIDDDTYKEMYEDISNRIDYLYHYYNDIAEIIEKEEFMSPSNYYFIRNISLIFAALNYSKKSIDKWYSIISEKKRIRIVQIHNNLRLEHYLLAEKPYFISWRLSKKDLPIYDLLNFYKKYYNELDFCELLRNYEKHYPLLPEEKILFFVLISIPSKLNFQTNEFAMCKQIQKFYDYLNSSNKLIKDYLPKDNNSKK